MPVPFKLFRGYRVPVGANEHWMEAAADRSLQPGDLVISSYPKNGTTWLQHIVFLLLGRGRAPRGMMQVIEAMPFPEQDGPCQNSRPLAVKYHLPFRLTPLLEEARFLYVARNPKDTCVSYYHFLKKLPGYHIDSFDEFFDAFLTGEVPYGDHLEHVLEWSEAAALRPNVFFLTYEDLSKNREDAIRRIARFLNIEAQDTFSDILKYSSFEFMRALEKEEDFVKYLQRSTGGQGEDGGRQPQMMRKGKVGDWRNYFTPEQSRRMDDRFHSKTRGTLLENIWTEEMAYTHDSN